ncbi:MULTISPECIES: nitroreductase family protein [unclassified Ruegeria]|uniref:nitroreductase n=1 Tax=unclassified Ruegeria TaxID=2625375 RepID=UPI001491B2DA|nr:nitroreductase [Ruegeria sp. HKCCD4318]NOE12128.1 nitroreductase [Ruegeria sp. HKCCD4318-2]NOG09708.1 nitroreductase [Ruegeria sp. HKCCD4315]
MSLAELNTLLKDRYSCRAFLSEPVPRAQIEQIVTSASQVPSWCNAQPWQLVITSADETDAFRKAMLAEAVSGTPAPDLPFPTSYSGVYQDRRRACGWALYEAVGVERGDRAGSAQQMMQNFALFGAPHCAILSSPAELGPYGAMDCGGFVTAFALAAQALGIATIPQAALATYGPFLHRYFQIPEDRLILCAISFGYADPDHPANSFRTKRAAPSDFVEWRD